MEEVVRFGQMVLSMRGIGKMVRPIIEGELFCRMEITMKENGTRIEFRDRFKLNYSIK